jgi:hypothetical protein
MQQLPDSTQAVDSINPDTFIWQRVISVDSSLVQSDSLASQKTFIDIFKGHSLKPSNREPLPLPNQKMGWLFFVLLFVLAIFTYLRVAYGKYLNRLFSALFNINITNQIVRDENILVKRASLLLNFIFYAAAALLLYLISIEYNWEIPFLKTGVVRFLGFGFIIAVLYFLKYIVLEITGWLFDFTREMSNYIFNISLINNLLGIALIPLLTLFVFFGHMQLNWLLFAAVALVGCAFLYRLIRGVLIGLSIPSATVAYLFLYICALEIGPLFVIFKLVSKL